MTKKEWLNRGRSLDKEIKVLQEEKDQAFALAVKITGNGSEISVQSGRQNYSDAAFVNYIKYKDLLIQRVEELHKVKTEILNAISSVENPIYRQLLIYRYIKYWKWEKIAVELNYNYYHVITDLHPKALDKIILPEMKDPT